MKLVKQIGYKLIVILCVVMTFCCFIASTPVEASKVTTGEFYYAGTTKGTYTVNKSALDKLIDALGQILDFLLGLATMGVRIVFVGWTVLLERCLTWIIEGATGEDVNIDSMGSTAMTPSDEYITLESIFFNRVPLLDINVFNMEVMTDDGASDTASSSTTSTPTYKKGQTTQLKSEQVVVVQGEKKNFFSDASTSGVPQDSLIVIFKKAVATWYYSFRLIAIMIMLVLLVFIGVKIAIQSSASDKALYKRVLVDWLVGMILVFSIHYIMLFIIQLNEMLVEQIYSLGQQQYTLEEYEYGKIERATQPPTNAELEASMYEQVRTRAYDARMSVGFTGMIMYMVLVFFAWKYTFVYLKRYLTVAILVIVSPIVAVTYAFNKVQSGKSKIFSGWLKEFIFTVGLQTIHALIYIVIVDTALALSLKSIAGMIVAFCAFNFLGNAEKIFRTIFDINGKATSDVADGKSLKDLSKAFKATVTSKFVAGAAKKVTKTSARIATKPIRALGNYGFGKAMERKANKLSQQNKSNTKEGQEINDAEIYDQDCDLNDAKRLDTIMKGKMAQNALKRSLKSRMKHPFSAKKRLKSQISDLADEYGMEYDDELEDMPNSETEENPLKDVPDYKLMWSMMKGKFAGKGRWQHILNPYQYVEKDEEGKYHRIKTERENGIFKKKTDSVSKRFLAHFKSDEKLKEALTEQLGIIKNQITGFAGILVGLPLLIAEPEAGMVLLGKGIASTKKAYGKSGNFKNVKILAPGQKFTLTGFAGRSEYTIANEALRMAREQITEIDKAVIEKYNLTVSSVKSKKSAGNIKKKKRTKTKVSYKVVRLNNMQAAYVETLRVANKLNKKVDDAQTERTMTLLDQLADKYYEMEKDGNTAGFNNLYSKITDEKAKEIDNMSMKEVRRNLGYKEEIAVITRPDRTKTLSGTSENTIIDNAIIESAQKCGIMDIGELELSDKNIEQITSSIVKELRAKKILDKDSDVSTLIEDIDKKIKDRQAVLAAEGTKPVEQKMADQAIVAVMKEGNITDPSQANPESVMDKFKEIYSATITESTKQSNSVAEQMRAKKPTNSTESTTAKKAVDEDRVKEIISDRTETLSQKANNTKESKQLRTELKRKEEAKLNEAIISHQERLESGIQTSEESIDLAQSELDSRKTNDVIQLLIHQTKIHNANRELAVVGNKSKDKKRAAMMARMIDENGNIKKSISENGTRQVVLNDGRKLTTDGSRRVDKTKDGSMKAQELIIDLENFKNTKNN